MSIIVAVKKAGRIALAADSQSNFGAHKFPPDNHKAQKIREVGGSLVAFSGWGLYENILDDYLAGKHSARLDDAKTIFAFFRLFWKQLREKYSFVNDQCKDANDSPFGDLDASFLVVSRNGIFDVSSNMTISHFEKYSAIGSGAEFALGALHALYDSGQNAASLARAGVETGMAFSVYCGGEITVRELSLAREKLNPGVPKSAPDARKALALLLVINLFSYLDRYILASIIPALKAEFLHGDPNANGKAGLLATAFLVSYMLTAPVFGWLADRFSRWLIIGLSVALWSLASGASGLAGTYFALLCTRVFLGIGEAGYGPAAPTIISDLYPVEKRGRMLAWFFMAIPVGSALGYAFGGFINARLGWRWAFYLVAPPGLLLALLCAFMREPRRALSGGAAPVRPTAADYARLAKIPSLVTNILAQTAMTFAIGGLSIWAPTYISEERGIPLARTNIVFGGILVVAGLLSTLLGGWLGDKLRPRFPGSYFLVSGCGMLLGFPATIAMLYVPFPAAWICIFLAIFFLFFNTGPSNTALANVTPPSMRATAFAVNILVIHLLGDALSPTLIGWIKDHGSWNLSFFTVSTVMLLAAILWLSGMRSLVRDTAAIEEESRPLQ